MNCACDSCIWHDQCGAGRVCQHYSPIDDRYDEYFYNVVLKENAEEYEKVKNEFGEWGVDW